MYACLLPYQNCNGANSSTHQSVRRLEPWCNHQDLWLVHVLLLQEEMAALSYSVKIGIFCINVCIYDWIEGLWYCSTEWLCVLSDVWVRGCELCSAPVLWCTATTSLCPCLVILKKKCLDCFIIQVAVYGSLYFVFVAKLKAKLISHLSPGFCFVCVLVVTDFGNQGCFCLSFLYTNPVIHGLVFVCTF